MSRSRAVLLISLLVAAFLFGVATGQAFHIGSRLLYWVSLIFGIVVSAAPLWQAYTDYRMLRIEEGRDRRANEIALLSERQGLAQLNAFASHVYQRAAQFLRTMPESPIDTWLDWGKMFLDTAATELRNLFLELQQKASAYPEHDEVGRRAHSAYLALEATTRDIYNLNWRDHSPEKVVTEAVRSRQLIRDSLEALGASIDRSQPF